MKYLNSIPARVPEIGNPLNLSTDQKVLGLNPNAVTKAETQYTRGFPLLFYPTFHTCFFLTSNTFPNTF